MTNPQQLHSNSVAFDRVRLARHPDRPYTVDFIERLFTDFVEIHGDRRYADDPAIVCGFALFHEEPVVVVGQQKGRDTKQRRIRNFGMPKPEGYRKALRAMKLAEKFGHPVLTLIDTPGAYPGIDAEERGQAEAIAFNLREMARLETPIIATVIGEGGSGIVYLAEQAFVGNIKVNRAIKFFVYRDDLANQTIHQFSDRISSKNFNDEILNISSFNHENIIKIIDGGVIERNGHNIPFIITDYVQPLTAL